ncbi:MAG: DUF177 domain-containing protein [Bacteroidaceae bacterium]|nr:DUF177 domain-containing protein [Bacteroidaceae bacterium]
MEKIDTYKIDFKALTEDSTEFSYALSDDFFELIEATEFRSGNLNADLRVKKTAGAFELTFHTEGTIVVPCDRCLDDMELPIDCTDTMRVKFGEENNYDDPELIVIDERDGTLNIAWYIYEFVALSIPIQHTHAPGKCNEELMLELSKHLATRSGDEDDDFDAEPEDETGDAPIDPRWEALKKLKS